MPNLSRRQFSRGAVGFAVGAFAVGGGAAAAQQATPGAASPAAAPTPLGYVSLRLRQLKSADLVPEVDNIVVDQFVPKVRALPGYNGYILGDVIEPPTQSLSVVVIQNMADVAGFDAATKTFVGGLPAKYAPTTPRTEAGVLYLTGAPASAAATPVAATPGPTPVAAASALTSGYVAVRIYKSAPGKNPLDTVPIGISGFIPLIRGLTGFRGYLWFIVPDGWTAISLFETQQDAVNSTAAAKDWVAKNVAAYAAGSPVVINAKLVYADLPVLTTHPG